MWKTVKLGEICELIYGKALDKKDRVENGIIPAYGANGIKAFANKPLCDKPSIIIGRKGSAGELNKVVEPFWALDVTYYVTTDESIVDLDFLFYALTTLNLPSMARGVKPGINRNDVYDKSINLPPLAEQQRIVAKLDAAFAEIDGALTNTEKVIQAAEDGLANLIDAKTKNRTGWSEYKVSDLGAVQTGNTPKTSNKENYGTDMPFVKPPNFQSDGAIVTANEGLSFQGASQSRVADKNSIMMVCIGATIGKVGVCSENVCFNQQINALTPSDKFDAELIYWQMRGRRFQSEVRAKAGQATLPIISKSKWQNLSIFVPGSLREQVEIRELLRDLNSQTEDYINLKQLKKRQLSTLKSAILAQELQSEAA